MAQLDDLAKQFAETKDNTVFVSFMELLEKSTVMVPAQAPERMSEQVKEAAKSGKSIQVEKGNEPKICLLAKTDGSKVFPIFTSKDQIPKEKIPPAILTLPFKSVITMVKSNAEQVKEIAVNPFSHGIILNENLVDLADRRFKAAAGEGQTVQLTEKQFHAVAHVKVSREVLPTKFFKDTENAFSDLRLYKEKMIVDAYKSIYPKEVECPYSEDDIAIMNLQIEEGLIISRIDLPEENLQPGGPVRIYITRSGDECTGYFIIEKGTKETPGNVAKIDANGTYDVIMEAPGNGAEIETIMSLIRPS